MNTSKPRTRIAWVLGVGLLLFAACITSPRPSPQGADPSAANRAADPQAPPADSESDPDDSCSEMFSNFYVGVDSISYNGYEIIRLGKEVRYKEHGGIRVTYAVLKSGGDTIETFDGVYFGLGDFAQITPLAQESKGLGTVAQKSPLASVAGQAYFSSQDFRLQMVDLRHG